MNKHWTPYEQFIFKSRYARYLETESRREDLDETVLRYLDFMENHLKENFNYTVSEKLKADLFNGIHDFKSMPSMRALMTAGAALERDNTAGFNCAFLPIDSVRSFDEAMYILLCGTGVGFSVESKYIDQLPIVPLLRPTEATIDVDDSKEGWAVSLRELLSFLFNGQIPDWTTHRVRKAGERLKTFGGRASGPEPLEELFQFVIETLTKAQGRQLRPIECHDIMCKIGDIVVVGGVRRSAMISLSDLLDEAMAGAKGYFEIRNAHSLDETEREWAVEVLNAYGEWEHHILEFKESEKFVLEEMLSTNKVSWFKPYGHRGLANNSAVFEERPDAATFSKEWYSLIASRSGERGIFNRKASQIQAAKNGRRSGDWDFGTNPCCVTADTPILTRKGYRPIEETVGQPIEIWNGEEWAAVTPYEAGYGQIYRVHLSDGTSLDCTPNHRWVIEGKGFVETEELLQGDRLQKFSMPVVEEGVEYPFDAYSQGFYSADGNKNRDFSWVYEPKYGVLDRLIGTFHDTTYGRKRWKHGPMLSKSFVPINGTLEYRLNWLAGVLDGDGTVTSYDRGKAVSISSIDLQFLSDIRLMLTTFGVQAKLNLMHGDEPRQFDGYDCKPGWRLLLNTTDTVLLTELGLKTERLDLSNNNPNRDARRFVRVERVEDLGVVEMTYCFTEPKTSRGTFNGIVTGNSEIILRPYQFCNLSEVVARAEDTLEDLKEKVRLATILGTFQSTLTNFPYLRDIWKKNTEEERLLGVSITGIQDHPVLNGLWGDDTLENCLAELKGVAIETNAKFAAALGIQQSVAVTCVKPSGTVSQLTDSASGIHARHAPFYIRTVRADNKDPLTQFLIDMGIPNEPCLSKPNSTTIFSFPMKAPLGAVTRNDLSALCQLENWLSYQRNWCEHKPSCTISVKEHEWMDVAAWVYKHFDEVSGISFMPHFEADSSFKQMPYQDISEEEYLVAVEKMPKDIDWSKLSSYEFEDNTVGSQTMACSGGTCELVDIE